VAVTSEPLDWRVAGQGALLALAVALPPAIVVRLLAGGDSNGQGSNAWVVAVLGIFAGFAVGGHLAARKRPASGITHASAAGAMAYGALAVYTLIRHLVTGQTVDIALLVQLALAGSIVISIGVLGGWVAVRQAARSRGASQ
jgi:hypothetical protein